MQNSMWMKGLVVGIIMLFVGAGVPPNSTSQGEQTNESTDTTEWFFDETTPEKTFEDPDVMTLFSHSGSGTQAENTIISSWYSKVIRWRQVTIRQEIFEATRANENDLLQLNLFDDEIVTAIIQTVQVNIMGTKTISGSMTQSCFGTFVITITDGVCLIIIRLPETNQLFITQCDRQQHQYYLMELPLPYAGELPDGDTMIPPVDSGIFTVEKKRLNEPGLDEKAVITINVMIVYTPAAKNWANTYGGGINNVISTAISQGQTTLTNSNTTVTWNLVYAAEVSYTESGNSLTDLNRLTWTNDSYMNIVHTWRNQTGADLVQLFTNCNDTGGLGWLLNDKNGLPAYGFSLVRVQQATTGFTSIHEFGHTMGCHHHKQQTVQPGPTIWTNWAANNWSAGWRWVGTSRYCTVMTYESGIYFPDGQTHTRVAYFSDPAVSYQGYAVGHTWNGNNARTIREIKSVIAGYRNSPPAFGTPSPANGSTNNLLSLTWSIPINDLEGNTFSWTIQCSNGQTNSGTGATNGTKTLTISGLALVTTYKVWVNATDSGGSGQYTRRWYIFTTAANSPPVFGTPTPANSSTNNPLSLTWSIPINDLEGNTFSWTIQCNNGQTNSATGATNGTKTLAISGLAYAITYTVWVNATDPTGSGLYTRRWYRFTTKANQPPVFGTPSPANSSTNNPLSLTWNIPINDPEGNTFSWTIQCNNGQTNSATGATNGTKTLILSGLAYSMTYKVWVNATDPAGSNSYTRRWYTFTTKANLPPVFGTPTPANGSTNQPLSLSWSIPINDPEGNQFSWSIQCSNGQTNSATGATNGTKTLILSGLAYSTTYKVWVNATDPTGSGLYTRRWYTITTVGSNPPVLGTPSPANGSTGNSLSVNWNIPINDPEGDLFSWTIQCNNSQTNSATGATNGTKTLALSGLAYATTYKIWVNATDPTGSGLYTRRWYIFTTIANQPPSTPTITGPAQGKINVETDYNFTATDPDGDNIMYFIEWGDGTNSGWIGPYPSGDIVTKSHTWSTKGTYTIKAKAKDATGAESGWGQLSVTMPFSYNQPFMQFWMKLLERFPHAFPILRHLLGY